MSAPPSKARWIDAHCHLADPRLAPALDAVIERSRRAGVHGWIQGGVSPEDWERQLELQRRHGPALVTSFGLHPGWVARHSRPALEQALALLERRLPEAQSLGEIGLDRGPRHEAALELQRLAFEEQLRIGRQAGKPLILHVVRAHGEALECLRRWAPYPRGGLVHLFSGSFEVASQYLSLGFVISVGATVARAAEGKGYQTLRRALLKIPPDKLVVETDSPDQAGTPGELNEPASLLGNASALAGLLGLRPEEVLARSTENLRRIFQLGAEP